MSKIIISSLICIFLLLFFILAIFKSNYPELKKENKVIWIGEFIWNYRSFEAISQAILILVAVFGIIMLVRD